MKVKFGKPNYPSISEFNNPITLHQLQSLINNKIYSFSEISMFNGYLLTVGCYIYAEYNAIDIIYHYHILLNNSEYANLISLIKKFNNRPIISIHDTWMDWDEMVKLSESHS